MSRDNLAGEIRQKGEHIGSDILGIGTALKDAASEKLHSMKDGASDKLHEIQEAASERLSSVKEGAARIGRNTRDAVNDLVTESPWKSIMVTAGVAAGAGLLAGWFFNRK